MPPRSRRRAAGSTSTRHRDGRRHLALEEREEAAARRHRGDAFALERACRVDERREQRRIALDHHPARRSACHGAVVDRECERLRIADVAARPRKARVEHDDAEAGAHSEVAARAAWS
jgi:hypothetical protein